MPRFWSEERITLLRSVYPEESREEILKAFPGVAWNSIQTVASKYKIRRPFKAPQKAFKVCKRCGVLKGRDSFEKTCRGGRRGMCKECYGRFRYQVRKSNPEWYERKLILDNLKNRKRYWVHLLAKYGITLEDYQALWDNQSGACAICGRSDIKMQLDHDHSNGRVRGLLCHLCNRAIGILEKPQWKAKAEAYLEEYKQ